jgi:hypothetical protein
MTDYVTTNIRLPKELHRELKRRAVREEKSLSQLVRESVAEYLIGPSLREMTGQRGPDQMQDPLWLIGSDPVDADVTDASVHHDAYLYGPLANHPRSDVEDR